MKGQASLYEGCTKLLVVHSVLYLLLWLGCQESGAGAATIESGTTTGKTMGRRVDLAPTAAAARFQRFTEHIVDVVVESLNKYQEVDGFDDEKMHGAVCPLCPVRHFRQTLEVDSVGVAVTVAAAAVRLPPLIWSGLVLSGSRQTEMAQ